MPRHLLQGSHFILRHSASWNPFVIGSSFKPYRLWKIQQHSCFELKTICFWERNFYKQRCDQTWVTSSIASKNRDSIGIAPLSSIIVWHFYPAFRKSGLKVNQRKQKDPRWAQNASLKRTKSNSKEIKELAILATYKSKKGRLVLITWNENFHAQITISLWVLQKKTCFRSNK